LIEFRRLLFWFTNTYITSFPDCPQSKLLNFFAILFGVVAMAAISSGPGQEEGATPYTTFPSSNNTFFYDVPQEQEEFSPMCHADFFNRYHSNTTTTSSLTSPVKYLADYVFLSE